ncbi:hypothetical protein ScPMuIL_004355 [Solemya velum]
MTLTCTATSYSPEVTFQWTKKGVDVGVSSGTYRFNPSAADNNAEVVCVAKNSQHLNKQTQHSVTLDILYSPASKPVITGYSTETVLVEAPQTTVKLHCAVGVANPEANLAWDSNCPNGNDAKSTRKISRTINVSRRMNGVICTCSGSQSGTVWTGADSVTFTVHYGPDLAEITGNTRVVAGAQMTLTCTANSYSPGFTPQAADDNTEVVCVAKNSQHLNQQAQHSVTLDILYSPSSGPEITGLSGLVLVEGRSPTTVTLTCTVGIANPVPTLTWNSDCPAGTTVQPTASSSTISMSLEISVHKRINEAMCTCSGSQSDNGWTRTDSVNIIVFYGTSNTSIQAPKVNTEGEDVIISCSSIGNPIPTYTITGPGSRHTSVQNTLKITDIDRSDSGKYSCTAVNTYNNETQTADVTVQYPPDVSVTYTNVTEGETGVVMTCEVTGEPPTYDFSPWKHIGPDKHTEIRQLPGKQNGSQFTLTLNASITYEDSGYYTCIVNNGIKGRSQQINQTKLSGYFGVEGSPKVLMEDNAAHGNLGTPANLSVSFYSLPSFTSVQWFKQLEQAILQLESNDSEHTIVTQVSDLKAKFHGKEVTVPGYITSVNYNNVTGGDFTSYTVVINNTKGSSDFIITLKGVTEPCSPHTLKEGEHTTTSVNISWTSGCNGGSAQKFQVEYKKAETQDTWTPGPIILQLSDSDNEIYNSVITGLDPNTNYHIRIKTTNVIGQNTSDSIEVRTLKLQLTPDPDSTVGPIAGGVGGAAVVILALIVVGVFIMRRRRNPSKGNNVEMNSNRHEPLKDDEDGEETVNPLYDWTSYDAKGGNAVAKVDDSAVYSQVQKKPCAKEEPSDNVYAQVKKPKMPAKQSLLSTEDPAIYSEVKKTTKKEMKKEDMGKNKKKNKKGDKNRRVHEDVYENAQPFKTSSDETYDNTKLMGQATGGDDNVYENNVNPRICT